MPKQSPAAFARRSVFTIAGMIAAGVLLPACCAITCLSILESSYTLSH